MAVSVRPERSIRATAPIRICDNGGWTDTWFAGHGTVFNIGVTPYVEVEVTVTATGTQADRVLLDVVNYRDRYGFTPGALPGRHPLLEAIVDDFGLPESVSMEISVRSGVPPGSSTGTSAAVAVALVGAIDAVTPGRLGAYEVAATAHRIEVDVLGAESGVQDQLCSAFGGINYIEIPRYPRAQVTQLKLAASTMAELDARLVLVYLGRSHVSSSTHEQVIAAVRARSRRVRGRPRRVTVSRRRRPGCRRRGRLPRPREGVSAQYRRPGKPSPRPCGPRGTKGYRGGGGKRRAGLEGQRSRRCRREHRLLVSKRCRDPAEPRTGSPAGRPRLSDCADVRRSSRTPHH